MLMVDFILPGIRLVVLLLVSIVVTTNEDESKYLFPDGIFVPDFIARYSPQIKDVFFLFTKVEK